MDISSFNNLKEIEEKAKAQGFDVSSCKEFQQFTLKKSGTSKVLVGFRHLTDLSSYLDGFAAGRKAG